MAISMSWSDLSHLVLMGVAGCGKSTIGVELSRRTSLPYLDGDELHDGANVAKMRAGIPLTDTDRRPWLDRCGRALADHPGGLILGCSALRRAYRDQLRAASNMPELAFIHLSGSRAVLQRRMARRKGHYMPSSLLQSQIETLEPLGVDEHGMTVDIDRSVLSIVDRILDRLSRC